MAYVAVDGTVHRPGVAARKTCPACTFRNSPARTICEMCHALLTAPPAGRRSPPTWPRLNLTVGPILVALAAAAVALNPSHESLQMYLRSRATGGTLSATLSRLMRGANYDRGLLWSTASSGGESFVGAFGCWVPTTALPKLPANLPVTLPSAITSALDAALLKGDVDLLAGAFVAVFLLWWALPSDAMHRHFTLSRPNTLAPGGRWHTLVSCAVSHSDLIHLALNLSTLYSSGAAARAALPRRGDWWLLWLVGALGGSAASLALNPPHFVSLGGSGALYGFLGFLARQAHLSGSSAPVVVSVYGLQLTPLQALAAHAALAAAARSQGQGGGGQRVVSDGTDHAMHLGGAAAGGLVFVPLRAFLVASGWW